MSNQMVLSDFLEELSTNEQQVLSGGRSDYPYDYGNYRNYGNYYNYRRRPFRPSVSSDPFGAVEAGNPKDKAPPNPKNEFFVYPI
jgi:hypothetical protein